MTQPDPVHNTHIRRTLELARRAWGQTHPNPMVGALIVEQGELVAEGWHHAAGQAHAEIEALNALGRAPAADATLYVTLEPCSTRGRTGACTNAIVEAGIRRVVVGATDPNPAHAGQGLQDLRNAGVEVIDGILAVECAELNLIFNHWILKQTPFLAAKIATTLDGKFAAANGQSESVTGEASRADVMCWRRYFPAIAVSAATALADNPRLTSRLTEPAWCPKRFVFDQTLKTVEQLDSLKLYNDEYSADTVVLCSEDVDTTAFQRKGILIWRLPLKDGHLDLNAFRQRCASEAIYGVYIEPGPTFATALIERKAIDYLFHYVAPKYLNDSAAAGLGSVRDTQSMDAAIEFRNVRQAVFGLDTLVCGHL